MEELTDRPPEKDTWTQTDAMMDRPPSPLFRPAKIGVDRETQIEEGDLFDFDAEVAPILEVLVGKTLEQGMDEVLEEEELENIRKQKALFEQQRNIELAEVQRLETEARRREAEKKRRIEQERTRVRQEEEMMKKIASRGLARTFFRDLKEGVLGTLGADGEFYDPVAREIETTFLPWLQNRATERMDALKLSETMCDDLVRAALQLIPGRMETAQQVHRATIDAAEAAAQEAASAEDQEDEGDGAE